MKNIAMALVKKPIETLLNNPNRLWSKVDKSNECWNWTGRLNKNGYGQMSIGNTELLTHRAAFILHNGSIESGMCVMHTCDNPQCCNPSHLKSGTHAENMADMKIKGRRKGVNSGCDNGRSKLTQLLAEEIRILKNSGLKLKELSEKFDVGISTISRVCRKENWA
jgi:hypothetical protein